MTCLKITQTATSTLVFLMLGLLHIGTSLQVSKRPPVETLVHRIENVQGHWVGFKAEVLLHFLSSSKEIASCSGPLTYSRLDERILLRCFNDSEKLLFALKTSDRKFQMYVPVQETIFRGDVFDLENSQEIESHLKPLDLYRALKVGAIPIHNTEIEIWDENTVSLKIHGKKRDGSYLARRLVSTEEGDVFLEIYYRFDEKPLVSIHRSNFKTIRTASKVGIRQARLPHRITIASTAETETSAIDETILIFKKIDLVSFFDLQAWKLELPDNTKSVTLEKARPASTWP